MFLSALAKIPNVSNACVNAKITMPTAYSHREKDPAFRAAWERALVIGIEGLEKASWDRAKEGTPQWAWVRTRLGRLKKVDMPRAYSDTLAIFLLKSHNPSKYRETYRTELSGPDGKPLVMGNTAVVIAWPHDTNKNNGNGNGTTNQIEEAIEVGEAAGPSADATADTGDAASAS